MNRQFGTGILACQVTKSIGAKSWPSSEDIGSRLARFDAIQSVIAMGTWAMAAQFTRFLGQGISQLESDNIAPPQVKTVPGRGMLCKSLRCW
jgi:hypothetical protein